MLKIRLRRMGSRHRPFYRVVVSDSRRVPSATALDEIGHYDPRDKTGGLTLDVERAESWLEKGARPSPTVSQLIDRARVARSAESVAEAPTDAKKAKKSAKPAAEKPAAEKPAEEPAAEAPAEEPAAEAPAEEPAAEKPAAEAPAEKPAAEAPAEEPAAETEKQPAEA